MAFEQQLDRGRDDRRLIVATLPHASFRDRVAAGLLDLILVVLAWQLLNRFRGERAFFLSLLAYHIGFWTWKGTTIGGIICQLRVVRVDGTPLRFVDALVRGLSAIFSVVVVGLGVFWILRDPNVRPGTTKLRAPTS